MTQNNRLRNLGFEPLEQRRLLAADVGIGFSLAEFSNVIERFHVGDQTMIVINMDVHTHGESDAVDPMELTIPPNIGVGTSSDLVMDSVEAGPVEPLTANHLDLSDGADGLFGSLDADHPSESLSFTAPENGVASVILSTSFGESDTQLEVRDDEGNLVTSTSTEDLDGFQEISFKVEQGKSYELTLSTTNKGEGRYQITVEFEADAAALPVDQHADEIGKDATVLELEGGEASIAGDIETSGDQDAFQFKATANGEASLFVGEMTEGNDVVLNVEVFDGDGNEILTGSTNEFVEMKFDVVEGKTYFIKISSGETQTGAYNLHLLQTDSAPIDVAPVDQHANEIGKDATPLQVVDGVAYVHSALETADDADAFRFTAAEDGQAVMMLAVNSEEQESILKVSIYDDQGELVLEGLTNEHLALSFDVESGKEYQVKVDSDNDITATYQMNLLSASKGNEQAFVSADSVDVSLPNAPLDLARIEPSLFDRAIEQVMIFSAVPDVLSGFDPFG